MDKGRKQFAVEVVGTLPLVLDVVKVRGKQVVDYYGAAKILVEKHRWPMALCSSHLAGKIRGWHSRAKDTTPHLHLPIRANIVKNIARTWGPPPENQTETHLPWAPEALKTQNRVRRGHS